MKSQSINAKQRNTVCSYCLGPLVGPPCLQPHGSKAEFKGTGAKGRDCDFSLPLQLFRSCMLKPDHVALVM